jgi:hypothetical protein
MTDFSAAFAVITLAYHLQETCLHSKQLKLHFLLILHSFPFNDVEIRRNVIYISCNSERHFGIKPNFLRETIPRRDEWN